jgi:hypothetical protein
MYSPVTISSLLYVSVITIGSFVTAVPLYNKTIDIVGGSLPNSSKLLLVLISIVKGF